MEVLTPRTLGEALALKAERPDAVPIQGGTDVMVELNFDRARPEAILNLNEVAELRGWSRENGVAAAGRRAHVHGGDGRASSRSCCRRSPRRRGRWARPRSATAARSAATWGRRRRRATRCRRCWWRARRSSCASVRGERVVPLAEFLLGPKKNALAEDELIAAVLVVAVGRPADVHEGGAAERDGDRGLLAGAGGRPGARRGAGGVRVGGAGGRRS